MYNGTAYAYVKSLQGDVIALLDGTGNVVVSYVYDAWGMPIGKSGTLAETLGTLNPFRYRGYVFDEETGLYYLRSRYYNPGWGRFVNADNVLTNSMFAYCANNPTNHTDKNGHDYVNEAWKAAESYCSGEGKMNELSEYMYGELRWETIGKHGLYYRTSPYITSSADADNNIIANLTPEKVYCIFQVGDAFFEGTDVPQNAIKRNPERMWIKVMIYYQSTDEEGVYYSSEGYIAAENFFSFGRYGVAVACPETASNFVNLRAGPGKNYELIGEVEEGTDVGVMAECDGWYYVSSYGMNGWMDGEFLPRH